MPGEVIRQQAAERRVMRRLKVDFDVVSDHDVCAFGNDFLENGEVVGVHRDPGRARVLTDIALVGAAGIGDEAHARAVDVSPVRKACAIAAAADRVLSPVVIRDGKQARLSPGCGHRDAAGGEIESPRCQIGTESCPGGPDQPQLHLQGLCQALNPTDVLTHDAACGRPARKRRVVPGQAYQQEPAGCDASLGAERGLARDRREVTQPCRYVVRAGDRQQALQESRV